MRFLSIVIGIFCLNVLHAQSITGDWQGAIAVGGRQIRIVFHITQTNGVYGATFDSPDQGATGMGTSSTKVSGDSIHIGIAQIGGSYRGKWNGADAINGTLSQGMMQTPFDLKRRASGAAALGKPQTPLPPFSYLSEEVKFENTRQQVHLEGTFTKPSTGTAFPVVILITGSGPQDRDETIGLHKSFLVIVDHLTKQGIAVLRVDDRGVGKSTGQFQSATTADFATDVMAAIDYLKTRKDIDVKKIGLLGHSEGAVIAPYVAARSKDVAFVVMLAGPVESGMKTMYYQAVTKALQGAAPSTRDAYGVLYNQLLQIGLHDSIAQHVDDYVYHKYTAWKSAQSVATVAAITHGASDREIVEGLAAGFKDLARPWWRFFLTYDVKDDLRKLQIPVFALNGSKDEQVDPHNLQLIHDILTANKNAKFKTYEVPGVNHLFQHCKDCGSIPEYLALDETFDVQTLAMISEWIKAQVM